MGYSDISKGYNMSKLSYPSGINRRVIGDWNCEKCNNLNFSFRSVCNVCKSEKPKSLFNSALYLSIDGQELVSSAEQGSWKGFLNEPITAKPVTSAPLPSEPKIVNQGKVSFDQIQVEDILSQVKRPDKARTGDWVCLRCKNLNFTFRKVCNKCFQKKDSFIAL